MARVFTEKLICRKPIYDGHAINFRVDEIRLPNGRRAFREYVDHPGAAAVVPLLGPGKVVLVRQYRHPVGETTYEIPAGKLDGSESPLACIKRELREETGFRAKCFRKLLAFWPAPAFSNESLYIYVADQLTPGVESPDEDEFIEAVEVPFKKALDWIVSGKIKDAKTIIGLLAVARRRRRGRAR